MSEVEQRIATECATPNSVSCGISEQQDNGTPKLARIRQEADPAREPLVPEIHFSSGGNEFARQSKIGDATPEWFEMLRCPVCKSGLNRVDQERFVCQRPDCHKEFPFVNGVPVLINDDTSIFRISDFMEQRHTTNQPGGKLKRLLGRLLPNASSNLKANQNYQKMERILLEAVDKPRVLIVGGGVIGKGLNVIMANREIEFIESDVALKSRTELICDGHDLPFPNNFFDGVIIQAVLEHVVDPFRCVEEIHRTLKSGGVVYAETPFMQGVHGGRFDFTRFTDLGHRRLFRKFEEIDRGACCGTGMALSAAYQAFLKSLVRSRRARDLLAVFGRITSFWLKYFDYFSSNTPASLDAASGLFFLGRKSDVVLQDRDLISQFRGASGVS